MEPTPLLTTTLIRNKFDQFFFPTRIPLGPSQVPKRAIIQNLFIFLVLNPFMFNKINVKLLPQFA